jgi:hypothetical protein
MDFPHYRSYATSIQRFKTLDMGFCQSSGREGGRLPSSDQLHSSAAATAREAKKHSHWQHYPDSGHKGGGEDLTVASASAQADSVKIDFRNQSNEIISGVSVPTKSLTCPAERAADWRYSRKISLRRTPILAMPAGVSCVLISTAVTMTSWK